MHEANTVILYYLTVEKPMVMNTRGRPRGGSRMFGRGGLNVVSKGREAASISLKTWGGGGGNCVTYHCVRVEKRSPGTSVVAVSESANATNTTPTCLE